MKKYVTLAVALALVAYALPAMAADPITITTSNSSNVNNSITAAASSGGNVADGAAATNSTTGGNVTDADYNNKAGNGGSTVLGGMGGMIETGNSYSVVGVENRLNFNRVRINSEPWAVGVINVVTNNTASLSNSVSAAAGSGDNVADGDVAANVVVGGNVDSSGASNTAGNLGGHIEGGGGGVIVTGNTGSDVQVLNVLNRNVTRIRR